MKKNAVIELIMKIIFFIAACASVLAVILICVFLFANGIPAMKEVGVGKFLFGQTWRPGNKLFGIFPFILGSIYERSDHLLLPSVKKVIEKEELKESRDVCKIVPAKLGEQIGDYAALSVAFGK